MKLAKLLLLALSAYLPTAWSAANYNIKYSSNYVMPAYVHFKTDDKSYSINAKINVPLYNIEFASRGTQSKTQFKMVNYQDVRNGKVYAMTKIAPNKLEYGKIKDGLKTESLTLPTFDLFTMAFQLSYYDKLPSNFQITNGKKLYPMTNVVVNKSQQSVNVDGKAVDEITYSFTTGDKDIVVKKYANEQFPRYIRYSRDGDNYELKFKELVQQ